MFAYSQILETAQYWSSISQLRLTNPQVHVAPVLHDNLLETHDSPLFVFRNAIQRDAHYMKARLKAGEAHLGALSGEKAEQHYSAALTLAPDSHAAKVSPCLCIVCTPLPPPHPPFRRGG